jgi:hypothetical protein
MLADNIEGLGPKSQNRLAEVGVKTLNDLRKMDPQAVDQQTHLGLTRLVSWQSMARLRQIVDIDKQFAEGLVRSGINDLQTLVATDTNVIISELIRWRIEEIIPHVPTESQVKSWQQSAADILKISGKTLSRLTPEVDNVWDTMTCRAMRNYYEEKGHPCLWFNGATWPEPQRGADQFNRGPFHAYDVKADGVWNASEGRIRAVYAGKRYQVPELLSGCRKAPILSVGLNPNLRGSLDPHRIYPYFDDIRQYAHHFRYRTTFKYSIEDEFFEKRMDADTKTADFELGQDITLIKKYVSMYKGYHKILTAFQDRVGLTETRLALGEDVSYYNFVACHSPGWDMSEDIEEGIIKECFITRQFFLRQFRQSSPAVVIIFSKKVMERFLQMFKDQFTNPGYPDATVTYKTILDYKYIMNLSGRRVRVVFAPHPTGSLYWYLKFRAQEKIVDALEEEYDLGNLAYDAPSGHLKRTRGPCSFCDNSLFKIGNCHYR